MEEQITTKKKQDPDVGDSEEEQNYYDEGSDSEEDE